MIKVTYYVGTNNRDTLKPELCKKDFIKVFDELFKDYTLVEAIGRFTNKNNETTEELSLIVTTLVDEDDIQTTNKLKIKILNNVETMKDVLNQESILVEIYKPETIFL